MAKKKVNLEKFKSWRKSSQGWPKPKSPIHPTQVKGSPSQLKGQKESG